MFKLKTTTRIFLLLILAISSFTLTHAQTATATLSGNVEDQNSASVPGASVTVQNKATSFERTATTSDSGSFSIPLLPPGTYSVTVRRDGFTPVEVRDVVLNVGDQKSFNVQLKVGSVDAAVQVTPEASLISTSPAVSTIVDRNFVGNLPLNGRSFQSLILLTPGVVGTVSDGLHPGEFSVNGQRQNANYYTVDGVSANTGVSTSLDSRDFSQQAGGAIPGTTALGTTASLVSIDALEEFRIQTSTYSAEYGRQPGAQVQLATRSGGNEFHGTAFEYLRNDALDANDWFVNADRLPKAPLRQNQFGGTFSGPVILPRFGEGGKPYWSGRNRTFFFFSYEGLRLRIPVAIAGVRVPSLALRSQAAPALQPFVNAFPIPNGPEFTNSAGVPTRAARFTAAYSNPSTVDAYSMRIDHMVNSKLALFGRVGVTPSNSFVRNLNQLTGNVLSARTLTLGSTLSITQDLNNEFRFNYSSNRGQSTLSMDNFGGAVPITPAQLTSGYSGSGPSWGRIEIRASGLDSLLSLGDQVDNYSRQLNIVDNLSWVKGSHQLKFGFDWRRLSPIFAPYSYFQYLLFNGDANIISSTANTAQFQASREARPIYNSYSAYAQDTWKASPRLTLDLGLRWEINPAPYDANGLRPIVLTNINPPDVSQAVIASPDAPYYKTFKTAFAPRIGVAYQLSGGSGRETILRGGFGVYYDLGNGWASGIFSSYPFQNSVSYSNVAFPLASTIAQPPVFLPVPTQVTSQLANKSFNVLDPNLQLPFTLEWNVALERSLGTQQSITISYVASAARKLTTRLFLNQRVNSTRQNPNLGNIAYVTNGPTSDYKSLQVQFQRRLTRGLQVLVNYTWARAVDEVSNEFDFGSTERGNADFDVRHNFSAALTYNLPRLAGTNALVRGIANGWAVDSVFYARTGTPLDLISGSILRGDGTLLNVRPDLVPGAAFWIKDQSVPGGRRLNPSAFSLPPYTVSNCNPDEDDCIFARQGTLGRNVIHLPGIYQLNVALRRQFNLGERLKLQLKAEAFNVLNHPLFGNYDNYLQDGSPYFGAPGSMLNNSLGGLNSLYQLGGARSMQLSLRLSF